MSNISTVKAAFADTLSGVPGLHAVYTTAPATLNAATLPALVVFAGPAEYERDGYMEPATERVRRYTLILYAQPLQAGLHGDPEEALEPFFERISAALGAAPRLGLTTTIMLATLTGDSGPVVLNYGDVPYMAAEFTVEVELC